jgi:pimeloyl-ACP methyl ester carboxylesterase
MNTDKVLILVHGFIKDSKDMRSLENFFGDKDDDIISIDLPTTFVSIEKAITRLCHIIRSVPKTKSITFLAHSMGGIISCIAIDKLQLDNIDKCVFIATPFKGSKVANFGDAIPFYSRILKPNRDLKVTDKYLTVCNKVSDKFPVGLIAGDKHSKFNILANICLKNAHDGLVEVESAFGINSVDRHVLNKNHGEIHHDVKTLKRVECFLQTGKF